MRLLWKYIRNYFLVYHLISHFLLYLQNYKEFEAEILKYFKTYRGLIKFKTPKMDIGTFYDEVFNCSQIQYAHNCPQIPFSYYDLHNQDSDMKKMQFYIFDT